MTHYAIALKTRSSAHPVSHQAWSRSFSPAVLLGTLRAWDAVLLVVAALIVTPSEFRGGSPATGMYVAAGIAAFAVAEFCNRRVELYKLSSIQRFHSQFWKLVLGLSCAAWSAAGVFVLLHAPLDEAVHWPAAWLGLVLALSLAVRVVIAPLVRAGLAAGQLKRRVAVVGAGSLGHKVAETITGDLESTHTLVGIFDDDGPAGRSGPDGRIADLAELSRRERVDVIVVAHGVQAKIDLVCAQLRSIVAEVAVATPISTAIKRRTEVSHLGDMTLVTVIPRALTDWETVQKAIFDRLLGLIILVFVSPVLLLVALAIRLESSGPVFFCQPRLGYNNVMFTLFKFRTMYHSMADLHADRQTMRGDPRVTRVGRWLRALSLDEVPQLLNVLRGDMSLVGPRPHAPNTSANGLKLSEAVAEYAERHRVKPGITGWAQVNGSRGELRDVQQLQQRVDYDLEYIQKWSLVLDIRIVVLTVLREIVSSRAF